MTISETLKFTTSPFFVFEFNNPKIKARNLYTNVAFKGISARLIALSHYCLIPRSKEEMLEHEYTEMEIVSAISNGIICDSASKEYKSAEVWEKYNWTRAAYLTFSQINLKYIEENPSKEAIPNLFEIRRKIVQSQLQDTPYPDYITFKGDFIALKKPNNPKKISADSIFGRDSIRSFEKEKISIEHFSSVIYEATEQIRALDSVRNENDLLQIFNSYFSWTVIFIAVQGVESIERGIYHYDPIKHGLTRVNSYYSDHDIYSCIQYQKWILGAGFCLFLCAQWDRYYWIYRHSRAYINLLIQVGELGQEFFQSANYYGMGGWGTPAIHESNAKKLLKIDDISIDPLYFLKIGIPKKNAERNR